MTAAVQQVSPPGTPHPQEPALPTTVDVAEKSNDEDVVTVDALAPAPPRASEVFRVLMAPEPALATVRSARRPALTRPADSWRKSCRSTAAAPGLASTTT